MTDLQIIEAAIIIWMVAFLVLIAIQLRNLTNALERHTYAIYRLIHTMEGNDDTD